MAGTRRIAALNMGGRIREVRLARIACDSRANCYGNLRQREAMKVERVMGIEPTLAVG
jgi:hypothetical protein